jgi:hypothetical protein
MDQENVVFSLNGILLSLRENSVLEILPEDFMSAAYCTKGITKCVKF